MLEGLKIRTKRTLVLFGVLVTAVACARSGTLASDDLDCGSGWQCFLSTGHCVYPLKPPRYVSQVGPHDINSAMTLCSDDPVLSRVAVVAIVVRGRAQQDAGADQLLLSTEGLRCRQPWQDPPQPLDDTEPDKADAEFDLHNLSAGFADTTSSPDD